MIPYQWTSAVIGLLIGGTILYLVRRDHLHGPYAVWWLAVSVMVVLISLFPTAINRVAGLFGVSYPPILPVVVGMGLILVKVLTIDLDRSRQERRIRRITQRLAMLESELERFREREAVNDTPAKSVDMTRVEFHSAAPLSLQQNVKSSSVSRG